MPSAPSLINEAWVQSYLHPELARALGQQAARAGGTSAEAGHGWLNVALAEVRIGDPGLALQALQRARALLAPAGDEHGLALCDEVLAIQLRRAGDCAASQRLQREIDARPGLPYSALDQFIAQNSRAMTNKRLGQTEAALRCFYAARAAAQASGHAGPRITAQTNLGGYHQELYNLDDARSHSEQALSAARELGSKQNVLTAALNLIVIYHAAGQPTQARAMAEFLFTHSSELAPGALKKHPLPLALAHLAAQEFDAAQTQLDHAAVAALGDGQRLVFWAWLQARCWLAQGQTQRARDLSQRSLHQIEGAGRSDPPYETMQLLAVAADACEHLGEHAAALAHVRRSHALHEQLLGLSARARSISLQASQALAEAQRERDLARDAHRNVEDDRQRLVQLNQALQAKVQETELLQTQLREQALRDPLTGLHNRRFLFEMAPGLLELARRQQTALCVAAIDLDHFKLLNDTYGHPAGDMVLQHFSALITQMLRRSDVVCRHGGEEFVVVLPSVDAAGAELLLKRLLEAYQTLRLEAGRRRLPSCSFSAGIALFPLHGNTLEQLLSRADRALYGAKSRGRARIEHMPLTDFGVMA